MEPNVEQADETKKLDNPTGQHAISSSDALFAYLTGGEMGAEGRHALAQTCTEPYALIFIKSVSQRGFVTLQDIADLAKSAHVRSTEAQIENTLVVFLSNDDAPRFVQAVKERGIVNKAAVAISLPFASLDAIPLHTELLTYSLNSKNDAGIVEAKSNAFAFLTARIKATTDVESLLHPAIAILARYDRMSQSNLLETLKVYLENDRNAQHSANLLYLHRNSLQYRVHRIQDIAGINLDDPEERAYLRLSFMLADL